MGLLGLSELVILEMSPVLLRKPISLQSSPTSASALKDGLVRPVKFPFVPLDARTMASADHRTFAAVARGGPVRIA